MKKILELFQILEDVEKTVSDLSERLEKTEKSLARLEQNAEETSSDISKLELMKSKVDLFNSRILYMKTRLYLEIENNCVYLNVPALADKDRLCIRIGIVSTSEPIEEIERRLEIQLDSIAFYHYFFTAAFSGLLELNIELSDDHHSIIKLRLVNDDEIAVEQINGGNIRVSYSRSLNVDARQKLVFEENSSIQFELSILDIVDDYDEYRVKAIVSEDCRLNDFDDAIKQLRSKIEMNEQFKRFSRQSEK